jgi:hypothetical protein
MPTPLNPTTPGRWTSSSRTVEAVQLREGNYADIAKWMGDKFEYRPRIRLIRIWLAEWGEWAAVTDGTWIVRDAFGHFERYTDQKFRHDFHKAEDRDDELRTLVIEDDRWAGYDFEVGADGMTLSHNGFVDHGATKRFLEETKGYDVIEWRQP